MKKTLLSLSVLACLLLTGNLTLAQNLRGRIVDACGNGYRGAVRIDLPNTAGDLYCYADNDGYWHTYINPSERGTLVISPELGGGSPYSPGIASVYINPTQSDPHTTIWAPNFTMTHPELATFKINGIDVTTAQNLNPDACDTKPIILTNNINPRGNYSLPHEYIISLYETNAQGTIQGNLIGTTGPKSYAGQLNYDLRTLMPTLPASPYVLVKLETKNCGNSWISKTGRFTILKLQAQARFEVLVGTGFTTASQNPANPNLVSRFLIGINPHISTGDIDTYTIRVDAVYSNGRVINQYTPILNTNPEPIPSTGFDYIGFNDLANGYFGTVTCQKYKVTFTVYNACGSDTYYAYLKIGSASCPEPIDTGAEPEPPCCIDRMSAYPNPTNSTTTINYTLEKPGKVTLDVIDITGKAITTLVNNEEKNAGFHETSLDMSKLSKGIYIYKLMTDSGITTGKILKN